VPVNDGEPKQEKGASMEGATVVRLSFRVMMVAFAAMLLTAGLVRVAGAADNKVEVCHEPGTPIEETLNVAESAVGAHISHGDIPGSCDDLPPPPVLDEVLDRAFLRCGVSSSAVGFSEFDDGTDTWSGFEVELCGAVAAAVLGDATAVEFVPVSARDRFAAVRDGTVDVLIRRTTDTLTRDATFGVNFGPTYFYDGLSIMARPGPLAGCVGDPDGCGFEDLPDGLSICVNPGSSAQLALLELEAELGVDFVFVELEGPPFVGFFDGVCDAMATDQSALLSFRQSGIDEGIPGAADWVIFNDTLSKEPLAPVVREGDDEWMAVVRWSIHATFLAEELGLNKANIAAERNSSVKASRAFGDGAADTGAALGLGPNWGFDIIDQVGNYAEMYDRNLTPLGLLRGRNASYLDGGLLYAPLIR
jgi:general L-amino acid transport system substrate-binding protein